MKVGGPQQAALCCAALLNRCYFCDRRTRDGTFRMEADKNLIGSILQPGIRFMQLSRRLGSQLTQLVAVFYVGKCPKNKIRAHRISPWWILFARYLLTWNGCTTWHSSRKDWVDFSLTVRRSVLSIGTASIFFYPSQSALWTTPGQLNFPGVEARICARTPSHDASFMSGKIN
jgi:hypothetical protein